MNVRCYDNQPKTNCFTHMIVMFPIVVINNKILKCVYRKIGHRGVGREWKID